MSHYGPDSASMHSLHNAENPQLIKLQHCTKNLLSYLPKLLSQQPLSSSIALTHIIEECNDLLALIQELKRQIVFRSVVVEGLEEGKSIFDRKVEEWNNLPQRAEKEWSILERGLGWYKKENST